MTFALGIYDLFAYSIPGFLYIGILGFLALRTHLIELDPKSLNGIPSLLIVVAIAIASYIVGHATWPLGRYVGRLLNRWWPEPDARAIILERDPSAAALGYLQHSRFLLGARAELSNREVASEISRMRAVGLMLRNCTV